MVEVSKAWHLLRTGCLPIILILLSMLTTSILKKDMIKVGHLWFPVHVACWHCCISMLLSWQHLNFEDADDVEFQAPDLKAWSSGRPVVTLCCSVQWIFFMDWFRCRCQPSPWRRRFLLENSGLFANQGMGIPKKKAMDHRSVQEAVGQQWPEHLNRQECW